MNWKAEPIWKGETCFIVAGGPSVREQNLELLRGRKVIAVNSSVHILPWADVLFFGDMRWWKLSENRKAVQAFKGLVVTTAKDVRGNNVKIIQKTKPPGPAHDPKYVMMRRTSLSASINLAMHFGCSRVVLLGADGQKAKDGKCHHHKPHPWPVRSGCWDEQGKDLRSMVEPLRKAGVEVLNASPGSAWDMWPAVNLEDVLSGVVVAPRVALSIPMTGKRLFAIGLPKSGTSTIHRALRNAGLESAHWMWKGCYVGDLIAAAVRKGRDPLVDLPECITQADVCVDGFNIWPQFDIDLLRDIRRRHPGLVMLLNTRNVDDLIASITRWRDLRVRLTAADIPGLPAGIGATDVELRTWIEGHYARCRAAFAGDTRFLEVDIADDATPHRIGEALGATLRWWGVSNANPAIAA